VTYSVRKLARSEKLVNRYGTTVPRVVVVDEDEASWRDGIVKLLEANAYACVPVRIDSE
jgi:hypothetical protein